MYRIPRPTHDLLGRRIKRRKPFKISTKKIEWMRAAGKDPYGSFVKTSRCRKCKRKLTWGGRTYEFDHKNNKEWDNSQKNCYLVCLFCHRKATIVKKVKVKDRISGYTVGYKTIKRKVGYKKSKKRKKKKIKRKKKKSRSPFEITIPRLRI